MNDWLFDLGNSRFKVAPLWSDGKVGPSDAWLHAADPLDGESMERLPRGATAWLASVAAADRTGTIVTALRERFTCVRIARTSSSCAGVRIAYPDPARLGVDRFLALLAAHTLHCDTVVVGVGTALTLDVLDRDGIHHGGRIAASPTTMRQALHERAAQLPETGGVYREFADDTDDSLASGCDGAAIALIERTVRQAEKRLGRPPSLLMHGGGAEALLPELPMAVLRQKLVLEGLAVWAAQEHVPE
ncbi:MAG: type III pantothenate kinase [Xanthomonadaceae bacterium]|jgi:type III pantothenate kinase|nr:type III pantothenate kinase [Xanthomonadaceae bacterium]